MQDRVIKTTIELAGEKTYREKMRQVELGLRNVNSQQRVVDAQFDKSDKSLAALTARYGTLQEKLELQKRKLEAIGAEYVRVAESQGDSSEAAQKLNRDMNNAYAQILKTEKALEEVANAMDQTAEAADDAGKGFDDISDNAQEAARSQEKLSSSSEKTAKNLREAKRAADEQKNALVQLQKEAEKAADRMSKALTAATTAAVTYSAKGFMDFEAEMSNVATLADTTAVSMEQLSRQAIDASNATGVTAKEIAQGAYMALSSGIDTANAMGYITEAAKAAKAGQSDLNTVVNGSTSIMNAWKVSSDNAKSVFEKLLVAQDKGKTTLGEISAQIGQITGIAPQLNMSLDETLAAVSALTKNGVQTSSAITGLRAVLSNVLKPTKEASDAAKALGLEFNAAALQSKGLTGFLEDVLKKTGGSSEQLAKLFGSVEGLAQIMLLGGSAAGDYADALEAMENSTGKLDKAFSTVTDNSAARLSMSLNKLKNNAIEFGQTLSPYIDLASESLGKLSDRISALSEDEQKSLLQTALWTAGGLKAISMLSKMVATIKVMGTAAGPVGMAAAAVTALVGAIVAVNRAVENNSIDAAWKRFSEAANANVTGSMNAIITSGNIDTTQAEAALTQAVKDVYSNVAEKLTDGKADTSEVVSQLKTDIASLFAEAQGNLSGLGDEAGTYAEQLQALEAETTAWVDAMAGKSTAYVQKHMGELEAIQAKVQEVIDKINEGNASLRDENSEAYKLATGGATTNQDTIARGVSWAYTNRELSLQGIREKAAADLAEADAEYAKGITDAAKHLAAEKEIAAWADAETAKIEQTYKDRMSEIMQGIVNAFAATEPENAQAIADVIEKQQIVDALQKQIDSLQSGDIDYETAKTKIQGIYDEVFGVGKYDISEAAGARADELILMLNGEIKTALDSMSTEDLGLMDTIAEILNSEAGKALNIDTTDMESALKTAFSGVGTASVDGFVEGLSDPEGKVKKANDVIADDAIETISNSLEVKSPSRVFHRIGQDTIQGFINGAGSKQSAVVDRFRAIARAAANAAKAELQINSPSKVFETIGGYTADGFINGINNKLDAVERTMQGMVNTGSIRTQTGEMPARMAQSTSQTTVNIHYSGAFTQREARRFGSEFAHQIAADNARKGG